MSRRFLGLALAGALAAGCAQHTQLVVVVDSDLTIPDELDAVRITVIGPRGQPMESTQALGDEGAPALPLTLGVRPSGEALGPIEVRAEGLLGGSAVVTRIARTSLVRGETRMLVLFLSRACRGVACAEGETCTEHGCAPADIAPEDLPPWTGQLPGRDAGADAGSDPDGGAPSCERASECDDFVDCTMDACTDGRCVHRPDDAVCAAAAGGSCDVVDGCQYPSCTTETCTAGPCQSATCNGDRCQRTSLCTTGQMCCGGACVAAGCDDGNPCTDDACGATGCEHTNNTAGCDDGTFCNGADTCSDGACAVHAGVPCSGSAVCDETMDVCTGCIVDADCGAAVNGSWGTCGGFADACAQNGTQSRSVTTFSCVSGTCMGSTTSESRACSRDTEGVSCGATSCGGFGSCGGFSNTCDESGTQSRTCTDYVCASGTCTSSMRTESSGCSRDTDGTGCGSTSCGGWGSCGGFSDTCDESGTQSRTCTDPVCSGGSCGGTMRTETQPCARDTDGTMCMPTSCGSYGACGGFSNVCDESGTYSRTCTDYTCTAGACGGASRTETAACARDTDGAPCNDGRPCTWDDTCSGGFCNSGFDECVSPCECTPTGCRNSSMPSYICAV